MPRKRILTKEEIIEEAFQMVKEKGMEAMSVRNLASSLHTSTQPIFTLFPSTSLIQNEIKEKAYALYDSFVQKALQEKNKPFQAVGVSYISFAITYPNLFRLLFMTESDQSYYHFNIDHNAKAILEDVKQEYGLNEEMTHRLYLYSWVYTHGLAVMLVTKTISLTEEEIERMLHEVVGGTYLMLKKEMENKHE